MNDFIQKIDTSKLTETDLLIYEYIKKNSSKIPWMTLEDLCQVLFVSNASIVRFCQHIGLKGFNELKFVLRNDSRISHNPIYEIIPGQLASFNDLLSSVSQEDTEKLCNMIKSHNTVYIYGRNLSSIPATYFYDMLMSIDIPCILIDWMDALASIAESVDNNTLLILISDHAHEEYFPIIETLKQKHASVVWICSNSVPEEQKNMLDLYFHTYDHSDYPSKINTLLIVQLIIESLSANIYSD